MVLVLILKFMINPWNNESKVAISQNKVPMMMNMKPIINISVIKYGVSNINSNPYNRINKTPIIKKQVTGENI